MNPPVSTASIPAPGLSKQAPDPPARHADDGARPPPAPRSLLLGSGLAAQPPGGAPPPRSSVVSANSRERDTSGQPRSHDASQPPAAVETNQKSMEDMMAAQRALAEMSLQGQLMASEMSMNNQAVGALTSNTVQLVTDQAKASKEAVRALGEAFQKAN